ncbi:MAG TPA: type II secretion system protein [Caldimonas sp.]|nr:type II secretion system protein [Caldimonas sp.]
MRRAGTSGFTAGGRGDAGVVLLAALLVMALLGIGLMTAVDVWTLSRQRERERELLFVGDQYRQAIRRYYLAAPSGGARALPTSFAVLLDDDRFPIPVHHLRRAYPDPITGSPEWGQVRAGDRIIGVYSLSDKPPIKQTGFAPMYQHFNEAATYHDWVFAFQIPRAGRAAAPAPAASSAAAPDGRKNIIFPPGRPS